MRPLTIISCAVFLLWGTALHSQPSASDGLHPSKGTTDLVFNTVDKGQQLPVEWGMDAAWISQENVKRGIAFIGKENIGVLRVSFQPTAPLVGDSALTTAQRNALNQRLAVARLLSRPRLIVNSDPADGKVDTYFTSSSGKANAARWAKLIDVSVRTYQNAGYQVVTVSPFNEPDYGWGQGGINDFREICRILRTDYADRFAAIRLSAGNTLNCDEASRWYNYMKPYADEGCTHQLAGSFNTYASFFEEVRADGNHATADELHNVMEAIVGAQYGMQTGIWWGFDGRARGQFCRASSGDRLAYAESRGAWAAGAVYRNTQDNCIEGFIGTSERQAKTSSWRFVCTDRAVFFDGYGPMHEYCMEMPGGNGYQNGQTNAERMVDIRWGEDVQPAPVDGVYKLANRKSLKVMSLSGNASISGTNVVQAADNGKKSQHWRVAPVSSRIGGDFSYHSILSDVNGYPIDVWNWSLDAGGDVRLYNGSLGTNEQWYLQYAGEGYYYIRSRYSNLCLEVASSSTANNANVQQGRLTGSESQQWKIIPVDAACEATPPAAPQGLTAQPQNASVRLSWECGSEEDLQGYTILRADAATNEWNTLGRRIADTLFIDNTCLPAHTYIYKVKASDCSDNYSEASDSVFCEAPTFTDGCVARWEFEETLTDTTENVFHGAVYGSALFTDNERYMASGNHALRLDGNSFIQVPPAVASTDALTVMMWVYWNGSTLGANQRLFDFGNDAHNSLYLTPNDGKVMRFTISKDGNAQSLEAPKLTAMRLQHVALTMSPDSVALYIDGVCVASSKDITLRPSDIRPVLNYLGRSQTSSHTLLRAYLDDVRIYGKALTPEDINEVMASVTTSVTAPKEPNGPKDSEAATTADKVYDLFGRSFSSDDSQPLNSGIYVVNGRKVLIR